MENTLRRFASPTLIDKNFFIKVCLFVPFIGGCISVLLGADANWDLTNYHIYNPFAFFNDKLSVDLAPAGLQTYFNPLLDIPYYWMTNNLPAMLVGFVMGFLHSGNFILVAVIARVLLNQLPENDQYKIPLLLAFFGCLTANFASAFGNTMGDVITALLVLSSLLIILLSVSDSQKGNQLLSFLAAGFFVGLATGLKLTNGLFAVALCASLIVLPYRFPIRLKLMFIFGFAVLAGTTVTAGYWFYQMWIQFGNPLFPQFSKIFPNELTLSISASDTRWGPRSLAEVLIWPIILSINPLRAGELNHHQIIWAIFYVVIIVAAVKCFLGRIKKQKLSSLSMSEKYTLMFVCIAFLLWLLLFSVQRYLVAIEVLLPLVIFTLLTHFFFYETGRKNSLFILTLSTLFVYLTIPKSWGHADWAWDMFRIELPPMAAPEKTTVIMIGGDTPYGWLAAQFPAEVAFAQIGGNFPANVSTYSQRINQMVDSRQGQIFALFEGEPNLSRSKKIENANAILKGLRLTEFANGCHYLGKAISVFKWEQKVKLTLDSSTSCHLSAFERDRPGEQADHFFEERAQHLLADYGYRMDVSSCQKFQAFIGQTSYKYRWCAISKHLQDAPINVN